MEPEPPPPLPNGATVQSRMNLVSRSLPTHVMWSITLITAVGMAMLNFLTILSMRRLVGWKFHLMQEATDLWGAWFGTVSLIACACFTATLCTQLIFRVSPEAGGSGAPENKGWLNGSSPRPVGGHTPTHLLVRGLATILGNASGYPVGREGPTVSMGSNFAYIVVEFMAARHVRQWVDIKTTGSKRTTALLVDEEKMAHAKRVACAVGGACGMAMIFDAPMGGILYMFEEVSAACWPAELTFRAFVGTIVCALLSRLMLLSINDDIKAFVVYEWSPQRHPWDWRDVPFFILLAAVLGAFSALHTKICLQVGTLRQLAMKALDHKNPSNKMVEAVLYAALCALTSSLVAQMGQCEPLRTGASVEFVRYNCNEGEYNPVASLLLTTSEGAVNLLFSRRNAGSIHPINVLLAFLSYTFLNIGLTGVPVPSGNFTGTMLIGGLVGRFVGACAETYGDAAVSGVYAMVGSAAMLCGFKRMSMAVVVFVATAANDFNLVPPLMLSVVVSLCVSKFLLPKGYDEEQLTRRGVEFLETEPPQVLDKLLAMDLFDRLPAEAVLLEESSAADVVKALRTDVCDFPVLKEQGVCTGFTTKERLQTALNCLQESSWNEPGLLADQPRQQRSTSAGSNGSRGASAESLDAEFERLISDSLLQGLRPLPAGAKLPVGRLVDPAPYIIREDMPVVRFYSLFAKAGVNTACVVSDVGEFQGMITRQGLITRIRELEDG